MFAIVRAASWLVPLEEREEWTAEWRAEYHHVSAAGRPWQTLAFCRGAFADAFWMRRNYPRTERRLGALLDRPAHCLLFLAALAAAAATVPRAAWLPAGTVAISASGARAGDPTVTLDQYRVLATRKTFSAVAFYRIRKSGNLSIAIGTANLPGVLGTTAPRRFWQLRHRIDAFVLDADPPFAPETRGFVLARMPAGDDHPLRWRVSAEGGSLECVALTGMSGMGSHLLMMSLALLAVIVALGMAPGSYPSSLLLRATAFLFAKAALAGA